MGTVIAVINLEVAYEKIMPVMMNAAKSGYWAPIDRFMGWI
jgi:hypothetical protein